MTSVSVLDDRTALAIRDAMAAARLGRIPEAIRIGEQALQDGGESTALNAMLGSLQCRSGNLEAGIRHLRVSNAARPADPVVATNLASALAQQGDYQAALEILTDELAGSDPTMRVERLRGFLAQSLEDFPLAIACYERVVEAAPSDWESWNNLGNARRLAADWSGSVAALQRAAAINGGSAPVRLNLAMALCAAGRAAEGESQLRKMAEDFPRDPKPLRELHAVLKEQGREEEALEAIEAAAQRDPSDLELLLALGSQRLMMLRTEAAESAYREAIAREPANALANLGLAIVFELTNRTHELAAIVREAADRGVGEDALNFIRAYDHRRGKRFAEGLAAIQKVTDELESIRRSHLLGQLQEGVGNYDEAFRAFTRMNELQREHPTRPEERGANYRELVRRRHQTITRDWLAGWKHEPPNDERPSPVFLVGFPRSGTTLLDTMLMGHPQIEVLEEEPTLREAERMLPDVADFPTASEFQVRQARDAYFRTAASLTAMSPGSLLIDKNPLAMNELPLIRRLFPDARIILALRHPCDVVLSCYLTNFMVNDGMASFLRLETAAELYDTSFRFFEHARDLFGIPVHTVVYENVLVDRHGELRRLLDFLGLEWRDQVLDHEKTALARGRIKTASYAQVAQPIYRQAAGRWQKYRKHLEPVLPVLTPWAEKFGYAV